MNAKIHHFLENCKILAEKVRKTFNFNLKNINIDGIGRFGLVYNNMKTPAQLVARKKNQSEKIELIENDMWNLLLQKI